uniref:Uncharacterized protein n=1 Tax=Picea sitchensis TaxID=3332 RepID=A9NXS8_PICSI|nr:unknown [Picea sitchensis]
MFSRTRASMGRRGNLNSTSTCIIINIKSKKREL